MTDRTIKVNESMEKDTLNEIESNSGNSVKKILKLTLVALLIYCVLILIPLYGVNMAEGTDFFYWLRVIMASQRGTLIELGIRPLIMIGFIICFAIIFYQIYKLFNIRKLKNI